MKILGTTDWLGDVELRTADHRTGQRGAWAWFLDLGLPGEWLDSLVQRTILNLSFQFLITQDPLDPNDTLIVIRSLVPGGVAQLDGRLIPGDRLLFVNDINLENSSLDQAVQALKGAAKGVVRIGVAKPLPMADTSMNISQNQGNISLSSATTVAIADHTNFAEWNAK